MFFTSGSFSDLRLWLLLLEVVSAIGSLTLDNKCWSSLALDLMLAHVDHLKSTQDLLLEFCPLDNGIVELHLRQIDEHTSDLRRLLFTNKFLNVLVDGIANDVLLRLAVWSLFVLLRCEHITDLCVVCSRVLGVDELSLWLVDRGGAAHRGHLAHALVEHLLLGRHLHHGMWLLEWRLRRWCSHLVRIDGIVSVLLVHHLLMMVVLSVVVVAMMVLVVLIVVLIWALEVAPVVLVPRLLLLHLVVLVLASGKLVHLEALTIGLRGMCRVEGMRASLRAGSASIVELEGGLEEKSQQVDQVLRAVETGDLCLILLILLPFLSFPVVKLFISDGSHLLWIAVLHV